MKNEPKKIYLQIGEQPELGFDFKELEGVTFSTDKINSNDLVYYSESEVLRLIKKHLDIASNEANLKREYKYFNGDVETDFMDGANIGNYRYTVNKQSITNIKIDLT